MTPDLRTRYLSLDLEHPVVASASPLTGDLDTLVALEEAGAAAVVLPSLFEEQVEHEEVSLHETLELGSHSFGEALTYFPEMDDYNTGPGRYVEHVAAAKQALSIPVIASINGVTPGGWVHYAELLQPDIDLETLTVKPELHLSSTDELRLPLRWIAILSGRVTLSLAATSGVRSADDVSKLVLAGADVVMIASELLRRGPGLMTALRDGLRDWLEEREYASVAQAKGSMSQASCGDPHAFERAQYVRTLTSWQAGSR